MSPAYRAHPLAQAIEEAARIFGPEVTAAALLAAVEAASVRSTTPSRSFRRKLWTTLAVIAFAALAGAVFLRRRPRVPGRRRVAERACQCSPIKRSPGVGGRARDCGRRPSSSRARTHHRGGRSAAVQVPARNGRDHDHDHTRNRRAHRSIHPHAQGAAKGIARACLPR